MSRRVTFGASSASPSATTRTAASRSSGSVSFEQEAARAGAQRLEHVLVEIERREDQHPRRRGRVVAGDARVASSPSISGMRMSMRMTSGRSSRTRSTASTPFAGFTDDLDVVGRPQQHGEPAAHQRLVVGDRDADHVRRPVGKRGGDAEAAAGRGPGSNVPP